MSTSVIIPVFSPHITNTQACFLPEVFYSLSPPARVSGPSIEYNSLWYTQPQQAITLNNTQKNVLGKFIYLTSTFPFKPLHYIYIYWDIICLRMNYKTSTSAFHVTIRKKCDKFNAANNMESRNFSKNKIFSFSSAADCSHQPRN